MAHLLSVLFYCLDFKGYQLNQHFDLKLKRFKIQGADKD